jgi:hypothetical protein
MRHLIIYRYTKRKEWTTSILTQKVLTSKRKATSSNESFNLLCCNTRWNCRITWFFKVAKVIYLIDPCHSQHRQIFLIPSQKPNCKDPATLLLHKMVFGTVEQVAHIPRNHVHIVLIEAAFWLSVV